MIAFEEVPPADRDVAVNGPLWDSHDIPTVEITTTEVSEVVNKVTRNVYSAYGRIL